MNVCTNCKKNASKVSNIFGETSQIRLLATQNYANVKQIMRRR